MIFCIGFCDDQSAWFFPFRNFLILFLCCFVSFGTHIPICSQWNYLHLEWQITTNLYHLYHNGNQYTPKTNMRVDVGTFFGINNEMEIDRLCPCQSIFCLALCLEKNRTKLIGGSVWVWYLEKKKTIYQWNDFFCVREIE